MVIAEDSVLLRDGLARLLADAGFDVAATVGDGAALVERVVADRPDLVVADIRMPPTHTTEGLQAAVAIRAVAPEVAVVLLSQYIEPRYAVDLLREGSGRLGYLLKERITDSASFVSALRHVAAGGSAIDPEVVARLVGRRRPPSRLEGLSAREREVLHLMAEGRSNSAIAQLLDVSPKTLEKHVAGVFTKLRIPAEVDDHRRVLAVLAYLRGARDE